MLRAGLVSWRYLSPARGALSLLADGGFTYMLAPGCADSYFRFSFLVLGVNHDASIQTQLVLTQAAAHAACGMLGARTGRRPGQGLAAGARRHAPVTNCADDSGSGTLRSVVATAASGDTVDLSQLACGTITLLSGQIEVHVDDLTIAGPGCASHRRQRQRPRVPA